MDPQRVNLGLDILDDQLTDSEDDRFGRVDDLELTARPGEPCEVASLLVGPGAWRWRVQPRLAGVTAALTPKTVRRIPWELVATLGTGEIRVKKPMLLLGVNTDVSLGAAWVGEIERDSIRLSAILGLPVRRSDGQTLGRVREVRAALDGSEDDPRRLEVRGVLVGRAGLAQRLSGVRGSVERRDAGFLEWSGLEVGADGLVAR
jgi:hypothetical protein